MTADIKKVQYKIQNFRSSIFFAISEASLKIYISNKRKDKHFEEVEYYL